MAMTVSTAFAATDIPGAPVTTAPAANSPLAPGKPAGVQQAQLEAGGVLLVVGILAVAGAIALVASTTQGHSSTTTTH
jgi:hypothetical protein